MRRRHPELLLLTTTGALLLGACFTGGAARPIPITHPANADATQGQTLDHSDALSTEPLFQAEAAPAQKHEHHSRPKTADAPPAEQAPAPTTYACPMHPEVTSDHPGTCPKCGMTLQPVDKSPSPHGQHGDTQ